MGTLKKEKYERAIGDQFIEWLNTETRSEYRFIGRPDLAPDLHYSSNAIDLFIEVTAGYYDDKHAIFIWRDVPNPKAAPCNWTGVNPNKSLAAAISNRIVEKSVKRYGKNTILLIAVPPGVTSAEDLALLLGKQAVQSETPFAGIYVVGTFPITKLSEGGYRVIPLKRLQ
jgi:hypothetical protein